MRVRDSANEWWMENIWEDNGRCFVKMEYKDINSYFDIVQLFFSFSGIMPT